MRVTGYVLATLVCLFSARFSAEPVMIIMGFSFMLLCAIVCLAAARWFGRIGETLLPTIGGVLYVGWLFSFQIPLRESAERLLPSSSLHPDTAGWIVLLFGYSLVWTCDTSAYFIGKRFGVRKLIPSISPGKTVAGALGGLVLTVAVALLYRSLFLGMLPLSLTLVIGVTSAVLAQAGDIFESALKRKAGVKDSSRLIPGHGGILDRFDGMLFALPAIYYILLAGAGL
jgi:phosphatidate cytidylyltransferase